VLRGELLIDVFSVEGQGKPQIDWVLHGIGGVTATPALTERTAPLGKSNGYQFLIALREGKGRESSYTFTIPGGKPHQVYCVDSQVATHVTGQGIGYSLRERTPFVMRRQMDRNAVFVTVHDLSGQERRLKVEAQFQGGTGRVPGADVQVKVHYGPTERVAFDFRANASNAVEITTF
jgi:hypothetical protein